VLLLLAAGCDETVLRGTSESEANRAAAALERHGVPATLASSARGRTATFELEVGADDAPRARAILQAYGLPRPARAGAQALAGGSGLVASPVEERARVAGAVARDVEQSIEAVDGVVEARVHVTFPLAESSAFAGEAAERPARASVLVRHLGPQPPLAPEDVRRLVAGAVDGLVPAAVEVVFRPVAVPGSPDEGWSTVGPFTVRDSSRTGLLVLILGCLGTTAVLAALLVWSRLALRKARTTGAGDATGSAGRTGR
jgi:type III secretion protein J